MSSKRYQVKLAVHERDRYRCLNCWESFDDDAHLDVDHAVREGVGGANCHSNKLSLCRRCHEAKHDERDHAPTIRWMSTGDMLEKDFRWYRHFWGEQLPALSSLALQGRIKPKFNLADEKRYQAWHISLGDVRRLDRRLEKIEEVNYAPLAAHAYM